MKFTNYGENSKSNESNESNENNESNEKKTVVKALNEYPMVSVCTATYNRRPFIPHLINCFKSQDYPLEKVEWIIVDDGEDKIDDLVKDITQVRYFRSNKKITLGEKRNLMNSYCKGDIIVYMDDDDYYPPERISHAVETLENNPEYLIAGCDELPIYFNEPEKCFYKIGPYFENHATAATFAFKKEILNDHNFNNFKHYGEEMSFLKKYKTPLVQLEYRKTIIVHAHCMNTVDKRFIFKSPNKHKLVKMNDKIENLIKNKDYIDFINNEKKYLFNYRYANKSHKDEIRKILKKEEEENKKKNKVIEEFTEKLMKYSKKELVNIILNMKLKKNTDI